MWRWLLGVLLALNIGVAGWLVFHQHGRVLPPLADPGVPVLELAPASGSDVAPAAGTSSAAPDHHAPDTITK